MQQLFLTRRNLQTLLNKLDRNRVTKTSPTGDWPDSACTMIKRDTVHPVYPATAMFMVTALEDDVTVTAVEDGDYYSDRTAGEVLPPDVPK